MTIHPGAVDVGAVGIGPACLADLHLLDGKRVADDVLRQTFQILVLNRQELALAAVPLIATVVVGSVSFMWMGTAFVTCHIIGRTASMRRPRIRAEGAGYYHCMSRIIERKHIMGDREKHRFLNLMYSLDDLPAAHTIRVAGSSLR